MNSNSNLWYKKSAEAWTQAIPIGNGFLGGMIYGGTDKEIISLNHDELWSGSPKETLEKEGLFETLTKAREAVKLGKFIEAQELLQKEFNGPWSQAYMPLGDLIIDFSDKSRTKNYTRSLNLDEAISYVEYNKNKSHIKREYFASYPAKVIAVKIESDNSSLELTVSLKSQLKSKSFVLDNVLWLDGECPPENNDKNENGEHNYNYPDSKRGILFRSGVKVITNGCTLFGENYIKIKNASEVVLFFACVTSFNGFEKSPFLEGKEYKESCKAILDNADNYNLIKAEHIKDYQNIYNRVCLDLGEGKNSHLPSDTRLKKYKTDKSDKSLITLMFNYGRYLAVSSSRPGTQPSNLQGIWNNKISPPWNSNYTVNINTEMNYWPVLMCDMAEVNEPLSGLIKDISVTGKKVAQKWYNAPGFVTHHNIDLWRLATPVPGNSTWSFWPGSSGWLCRHLFEQYEYTNDIDFLRNTAYPLMKESARFYLSQLCDNGEGKLIYPAGTSPENSFIYNGKNAAIGKTSTMLMAIIKDLFTSCIKASEILCCDNDFSAELKSAVDNMLPFLTGSKGQLLEWDAERPESEPHHRHVSHLYALHPANLITSDGTPDLADACRKTLKLRGDNGTGWSLGWKINFWARLFDGDHALKLINLQLRPVKSIGVNYTNGGGTYENFFDAHPPFQIDGNFGFVSGVAEMLMQSRENKIYILPALPSDWKNGKVNGLLAKGNVKTNIEWENGALSKVELTGKGTFEIIYNGKSVFVDLTGSKTEVKF